MSTTTQYLVNLDEPNYALSRLVRFYCVSVCACMCAHMHTKYNVQHYIIPHSTMTYYTVNIFVWLPATPTSRMTLYDSAKWNKTLLMRVKYRSTQTVKSTSLCYKRCQKCCPCTGIHTLYYLNSFEIYFVNSMWINDFELSLVQDLSVVSEVYIQLHYSFC